MHNYLSTLLLMILLSACSNNNNQQPGCPSKMCTLEFVKISVNFVDKDNAPVLGLEITAVNLRTHKAVVADHTSEPVFPHALSSAIIIATDNNKREFATEGDNVAITAKNTTTGATTVAAIKIAGGCLCHISKVSGPYTIVVN